MPNQVHTWPYHKPIGYAVMAACLGSFYLACSISPGVIKADKASLARVAEAAAKAAADDGQSDGAKAGTAVEPVVEIEPRHAACYPHDGVVFVRGYCKTCRIPK